MGALLVPLLLLTANFEKPRVAVLEIAALDEAVKTKAAALEELVLTELSRSGALSVSGRSDLAALIGFERQRQLLGCGPDGSCMAEIGAAMGAPWLVLGSVSSAGSTVRVDLKLLEASTGRVILREGQVVEREEAWYQVTTAMLRRLEAAIPLPRGAATARPVWPFIVAGLGVVAGATGATLMGVGVLDAQRALAEGQAGTRLAPGVASAYDAAASMHDVGAGLAIGGAGLTVVGVVLVFVTGAPAPAIALTPVREGAVFSFGGRF